jgi:hypothetical protein
VNLCLLDYTPQNSIFILVHEKIHFMFVSLLFSSVSIQCLILCCNDSIDYVDRVMMFSFIITVDFLSYVCSFILLKKLKLHIYSLFIVAGDFLSYV